MDICTMLNCDNIMWFGPHKGKKLKDVPSDYLLFLYRKNIAYGALRIYINENLSVLNAHNAVNNKSIFFNKRYYLKGFR